MVQKTLITKITIPEYIREVQLSKKVRPKYWEWDGTTIKCKSKKLLQKYINPKFKKDIISNDGNVKPQWLKPSYRIVAFKGKTPMYEVVTAGDILLSTEYKKYKYYLCTYDTMWTKVIANSTKVDKPRIQIINGQNIYNHTASPFTTGKIFDTIKEMYYQKFKTIPAFKLQKLRTTLQESYPIMIEVELRDTVKNYYDNTKKGNGRIWDVGNRTDPYMKTFYDFLTNGLRDISPIIIEDDRLHVTSGNNSYFTPVATHEERALVFHIYQDTRECWKEYNISPSEEEWKEYCLYLTNNPNTRGLIEIASIEGFKEWKNEYK